MNITSPARNCGGWVSEMDSDRGTFILVIRESAVAHNGLEADWDMSKHGLGAWLGLDQGLAAAEGVARTALGSLSNLPAPCGKKTIICDYAGLARMALR
jgi:hypothetical protein